MYSHNRRFKYLLKLFLTFTMFGCSVSCAQTNEDTCFVVESEDVDRRSEQLKYLAHIFYPEAYLGTDTAQVFTQQILTLDDESRERAGNKYKNTAKREQELLDAMYPGEGNIDLRLLALSDRDSDGIPDYRINGNGEFFENDIDLDDDGILNAIDLEPFRHNPDVEAKDADEDGIADHLDWSNNDLYDKSDTAQSIQSSLFDQFGITLVESRLEFDPTAISVVNDTFTKVLASKEAIFKDSRALEFVVSTCSDSMFNNWGTWGEVPAGTQKMYLYEPLLADTKAEKNKLATFLVSVHEAIHTIQYALDFKDSENMLRYNLHRNSKNFVNEMNRLGWKLSTSKLKDMHPEYIKSYVDNETEETLFAEIKTHDGADIKLSDIRDVHYAADPEKAAVKYNIVHSYSLDNVWEWHAENVTVSVLDRMYRELPSLVGESRAKEVIDCVNESLGNGPFNPETYSLAVFDPDVSQELQAMYPISDSNLKYLAEEYIVNAFDGECT